MKKKPIDDHAAAMFASGKTVWRSLMNQHVMKLRLESPILDLGAGSKGSSSYHNIIPNFDNKQVYSIDAVFDKHPTIVANVEQSLPLRDELFKTVLVLNLLEHIYEYRKLLDEVFRILEKRGNIYIAVPFLFRVHGDPGDFYRFTGAAIEKNLKDVGFSDVQIETLGSGAITAALAQVDFLIPLCFRKIIFKLSLRSDSLIGHMSRCGFRNKHDYPIGYIATALKS